MTDPHPPQTAPTRARDDRASGGGAQEAAGLGVSPRLIRWGAVVFVAATIVGFGFVFFYSQDVGASLAGFRRFELVWALPCLAFASLDWFGGGVRVWLLLRPLDMDVSYWSCVKISGATAGLAYLTPSGMGGGPAHLYGLVRTGASVGKSAASNFASLLVNLVFLCAAGFGAWVFGAHDALQDVALPVADLSAGRLFEWTVRAFGVVVGGILLFAVNPRPARGLILWIFGRGRRVRTILRWIHELHESLLIYAKAGKIELVVATLSGVLHFGGRFLLGWAVLRGFGIDAGFWNIVTLHVMLQFFLMFMPTPGGTGIGEALVVAFMEPFVPTSLLVAYTAVWRVFLTYLTVLAGGGLLLRWVGIDQRRLAED